MKITFTPFTIFCCFLFLNASAQSDQLDSSFGVNGKVVTAITNESTPYGIAVQANGKIIVAGNSFNGSDFDIALVKYRGNGKLDNTFGTGGKVITDLGGNEIIRSVNRRNAKIIVAGSNGSGFLLLRYNLFGRLDSTFGDNGKTITDFGGSGGFCYASAIQTDGKIIAVGNTEGNAVAVRYNTNGKVDTKFGNHGILIIDSAHGFFNAATAVALQPDGKIVTAGYTGMFGQRKFLITRINTNGTIDSSFGNNGRATTNFGNFSNIDNLAFSVAISPIGRIYAAGQASGNETSNFSKFAVAAYTAAGRKSSTFNGNGKVLTDFDGANDGANSVVIMPDGKITVVGILYSQNLTGVAKYNINGSLDSSFGTNGKLITNYQRPTAAILQNDGKLLVAVDNQFTLVRYKADNSPLTTSVQSAMAKTDIKPEIKLFPNPVTDIVNINNLKASTTTVLSVINVSGKTVLRATTSGSNCSLNVRSLPAGVYYLHIISGKKITDLKFVKQ